jgi:hypothetical protein
VRGSQARTVTQPVDEVKGRAWKASIPV